LHKIAVLGIFKIRLKACKEIQKQRRRRKKMCFNPTVRRVSESSYVDPAVRGARVIQQVRQNTNCPSVAYCAAIGGLTFVAIPPNGAFVPVGMAVGAIVGVAISNVKNYLEGNYQYV
jgi:hypothetical protein